MDTNNYTIEELLSILNLDMDIESVSASDITRTSNIYIKKFDDEGDVKMTDFFNDIQTVLLDYKEDVDNINKELGDKTVEWITNENLTQSNPVQSDKITDRKQKIAVFDDNQHLPMKRQQLGINTNFPVPVAQDSLNPNLKNITSRFINLDSQYRQPTGGVESGATDYTLDLSEPLNNVLSLRLYSIQIPFSWYTIDSVYGNTCFWLVLGGPTTQTVVATISVEPGNYTPQQLVSDMNIGVNGFGNPDFVFPPSHLPQADYPINYNSTNGKISISLPDTGFTYKGVVVEPTQSKIVFYDATATLTCSGDGIGGNNGNNGGGVDRTTRCVSTSNVINQTLGWVMGFRTPSISVESTSSTAKGKQAEALIELYGPKYLILAIDDFNQNHINNGLITITELSKNLKMPSYYTPTLPQLCIQPSTESFKNVPQVVPTAPRVLTQAQIYSINEIKKNNSQNTKYKSLAPSSSDTFALIPVKHDSNNNTGGYFVEFGGSMQDNKRIYFGPVNIERMRVKLYDDRGNILNMNGADWSFTIIAEILYQY